MIYVHVPFCRSFCIYCGFYSETAVRDDVEKYHRYADCVIAEIHERREEILKPYLTKDCVDTLYFGGGTPSVLPVREFRRITEAVNEIFGVSRGSFRRFEEFTVEVNPEDIVRNGEKYVKALAECGVNRISMGIQSFDDDILRRMRRRHSADEAGQAFRILRNAGMENISVDLIFGIPFLDDDVWRRTLNRVVSLFPEHISAYQLSIDDNSCLGRMHNSGKFEELPDGDCRRQYDILCSFLSEAGYCHYEISNFALPGREAVHNSAYWSRVPYVGLGPGAHSLRPADLDLECECGFGRHTNFERGMVSIPRIRTANEEKIPYGVKSEYLSERDIFVETIMLGLRTDKGVKKSYIDRHAGKSKSELMLRTGSLEEAGDCLRIPEDRFFVSDQIICDLI